MSESIAGVTDLLELRNEMRRFMLEYKFGIDEIMTKIAILREDFGNKHEYNPIEHVTSRLKEPESIWAKAQRKGSPLNLDDIRANIFDIAGIRVVCSFVSDIYRVRDMIAGQSDIKILSERDYIANTKPNGYQSLHLIAQVPVFLSDRVTHPIVEIQIRTIAMDFWASLEHKIYYKYNKTVPEGLLAELKEAADTAAALDEKMENLHRRMRDL